MITTLALLHNPKEVPALRGLMLDALRSKDPKRKARFARSIAEPGPPKRRFGQKRVPS